MVRGLLIGAVGIGFLAGMPGAVWASPPLTTILSEDFSNDPVANGRAVIQSDDGSAASRFVTTGGTLTAAYDTSKQSAKLVFSLGQTLTQNDSFTYSTKLKILSSAYAVDNTGGDAQIAFGLINSVTTGLNRSGSDTTNADTFDMMTVDYFPNVNPFFDSESITPTEFNSGTGNAFDGINAPFNSESITDESGEVGVLPRDTAFTFNLAYDASTRVMTVTLNDSSNHPVNINEVGDLGLTGGPDGNVDTIQYTLPPSAHFSVDSFGILLWQDGFDKEFSEDHASSVIANVQFDQITVEAPEPTSLAVIVLPMAALSWRRRRAGV